MALEIKTNHHWRPFAYRNEVPAKVLADQFDWTNEDDHYDGFFQYRGCWYHLSEFPSFTSFAGGNEPFKDWHGYHPDSAFSGILIRVSRDGERFRVGTYFA